MNMDVDSSALDLSADDEADLRMRARAHADRIRVRSAAADCETKQCKPKQVKEDAVDGVYFAGVPGTLKVKIGKSKNVHGRLRNLSSGCPDDVVLIARLDGYTAVERWCHQRFAQQRYKGEWFLVDDELKQFMERVNAGMMSDDVCAGALYEDRFGIRQLESRGELLERLMEMGVPELTVVREPWSEAAKRVPRLAQWEHFGFDAARPRYSAMWVDRETGEAYQDSKVGPYRTACAFNGGGKFHDLKLLVGCLLEENGGIKRESTFQALALLDRESSSFPVDHINGGYPCRSWLPSFGQHGQQICKCQSCRDASRGWNVGGVMWMIVHSLRELCSEWMIVQVSDFKRG